MITNNIRTYYYHSYSKFKYIQKHSKKLGLHLSFIFSTVWKRDRDTSRSDNPEAMKK